WSLPRLDPSLPRTVPQGETVLPPTTQPRPWTSWTSVIAASSRCHSLMWSRHELPDQTSSRSGPWPAWSCPSKPPSPGGQRHTLPWTHGGSGGQGGTGPAESGGERCPVGYLPEVSKACEWDLPSLRLRNGEED